MRTLPSVCFVLPVRLFMVVVFTGLLSLLPGTAAVAQTGEVTGTDHKAVISQFYEEVLNQGDFRLMPDLFAPDYTHRAPGGVELTLDTYTASLEAMRTALPDFTATVEVLLADVDGIWAASRVVYSGTLDQDWEVNGEAVEPTGKKVTWALNVMHRFNDAGQLVEDQVSYDRLSLYSQLGISPLPALLSETLLTGNYTPAVMTAEPAAVAMEAIHEEAFLHVMFDAINDGDLDAIDMYMSPDHIAHEPFGNFTREQFREVIAGFRATVPDLVVTVDAVAAEGDWLAARVTYAGTFSQPIGNGILTIPPTNEPIFLVINVFVRYQDGIGIEDFKEYDRLGWLQQGGLLPTGD